MGMIARSAVAMRMMIVMAVMRIVRMGMIGGMIIMTMRIMNGMLDML